MRTRTTESAPYRFSLKTMPPHFTKQALAPARLLDALRDAADLPLVVLTSRAGFGKTSLLVQLRRELIGSGGAVAWLNAEAADDAAVFIPALLASLRIAIGLDLPEGSFEQVGPETVDLWVASELLAHVHELARPTYLLIDDLHNLVDPQSIDFIDYLIRNAPPNFHAVVSSRADPPFPVDELAARGLYAQFVTDDLRLRLEDTVAFLRRRLGDGVDIETCARLHERIEGWPMGLQIVTAALARKNDVAGMVAGLSGATGDMARYFSLVVDGLEAGVADMLVRSSILKTLHPPLCAALTGLDDTAGVLARLEQNTGLVASVVGSEQVYRLHPLFGEYLRSQLDALAHDVVHQLHGAAAEWLAAHGMIDEAAEHAFAAGRTRQAMDWIARRLRYLGAQGRIVEVLAWLDRLPPDEIAQREEIQLTAAWACALCYRPKDAGRLTDVILARPEATPETLLQANIVRSAVAIHCDDYERARACIESHDPELGSLYCNSLSFIAMHSGFPERARYYQQIAEGRSRVARSFYDAMYGGFATGLSYLIEGLAGEAAEVFRALLERAEATVGWRSLPAAMQAAGLAAASWELGAEEDARALLANRLDLIEQAALPDAVILAYVTLARYESQKGREGKAFDALNSLAAIGDVRRQPRLVAASLAEQIRQHASRNRLASCRMLLGALDDLIAGDDGATHGLQAELRLMRETAVARVALLDFDFDAGAAALDHAERIAARLRRGRDQIGLRLLRACCTASSGESSLRLLAEALSLAESFGLVRVVADDWPAAIECVAELEHRGDAKRAPVSPDFIERVSERCRPGWLAETPPREAAETRPARAAHLSAREMELLGALVYGRSNKEIARMLDVGTETIKWHMKNLLAKLSAANRRHAVDRARLLGIID